MKIQMKEYVGGFAENKDTAKFLRKEKIEPTLSMKERVILDFLGVEGATQSFIHALISETYRVYGDELLDRIDFKNCNNDIKGIINIVIDYLSESI